MKFRLEIELGDGHDQPLTLIVSSLRDVACTVQSQGILFAQTRAIANHNGKNVGEWEITEDAPSPADRAIVDALPTADTAKERTRTGNTPSCEDCGLPIEDCECEPCDECEGVHEHGDGCSLNPANIIDAQQKGQ